jgi:hypothetical protein
MVSTLIGNTASFRKPSRMSTIILFIGLSMKGSRLLSSPRQDPTRSSSIDGIPQSEDGATAK